MSVNYPRIVFSGGSGHFSKCPDISDNSVNLPVAIPILVALMPFTWALHALLLFQEGAKAQSKWGGRSKDTATRYVLPPHTVLLVRGGVL